jgi:adenylate kinase
MLNLLIMGKPGAGKGTQSTRLLDYYRLKHISTGNVYREEIQKRSAIGIEAEQYILRGELVPDDLTNGIVKAILERRDYPSGFMLDGYPRTAAQAVALDQMLAGMGMSLSAVISVEVDDSVLLERMAGRRVCKSCNATYHTSFHPPVVKGVCDLCGGELIQRSDDLEESVLNRLRIYNNKTRPLLDFYQKQGLLMVIDGRQSSDGVFADITRRLGDNQRGND